MKQIEHEEVIEVAEPSTAGPSLGLTGGWGLLGILLLFGWAIYRLGGRGLRTVLAGLEAFEWGALAVLTLAFVYGEGVRALQRRWVPVAVGRAMSLEERTPWFLRVLAPLYAMSLIGATGLRLLRAWLGVSAVLLAVWLVSSLPDPWRGIVDLSVSAALLWAAGAIVHQVGHQLSRGGGTTSS